jgi:hypothetical protein
MGSFINRWSLIKELLAHPMNGKGVKKIQHDLYHSLNSSLRHPRVPMISVTSARRSGIPESWSERFVYWSAVACPLEKYYLNQTW